MTAYSTQDYRVAMYRLAAAGGQLVRHTDMCGVCGWQPGALVPRPVCGEGMALQVRRDAAARTVGLLEAAAQQLAAGRDRGRRSGGPAGDGKDRRRPPRWAPGPGQEVMW